MTPYSSYLNDLELRTAADQYAKLYGGTFSCAESGDLLVYTAPTGASYVPIDDTYSIAHLTKRLRQATKRKYTVDLLTLWWVQIRKDELKDISGFFRKIRKVRKHPAVLPHRNTQS